MYIYGKSNEFMAIKGTGDKLLMNKFMRQNFGEGLTLKNRYLERLGADSVETTESLGNGGSATRLFWLIDCTSLRCYKLPKLRFCKT